MNFQIDFQGILDFFDFSQEKNKFKTTINEIHNKLHYNCQYQNFLGWLKLPFSYNSYDTEEILRIQKLKNQHSQLEVLVVVGIGGSYLGAKAGLEFIKIPFLKQKVQIIFAGYNLSGIYLQNLILYLKDKDWAINVISKSGNTLEPAITFRILQKKLSDKYHVEELRKRIFVTTDDQKGILFQIAAQEGYEKFIIPDSVGGRYSVLTAVGILPFIFGGLDIDSLFNGAKKAYYDFSSGNIEKNLAYQYALARYILYKKLDKKIEILINYEPNLFFFAEWWKQLFAETEGKKEQGLFVSSLNYTTDLHSLGQFIQEGSKIMFETILNVQKVSDDLTIPYSEHDLDNLNFLSGKTLSHVNQEVLKAVKSAHIEGKVPNMEIKINQLNEYNLGYLFYFFEKACAMSALLLNVHPFTQPGVDVYKQKMLFLLKK